MKKSEKKSESSIKYCSKRNVLEQGRKQKKSFLLSAEDIALKKN